MWFCCHLTQSTFKSCFGPFDIWKTWNGWSHVVHPSKENSAATKTYLEIEPRTTSEEPITKTKQPAVFLQIHISASCRDPLPPGWSGMDEDEMSDCKVSVEVHPGPMLPLSSGGNDSSSTSQQGTPSGSDTRHLIAHMPGLTSPQGVGAEWGKDVALALPPNRTPSTDWTMLESNLDFWRREHSRTTSLNAEEDETSSKVRYNDMGSLEQVNVEHLVDYYIDDDEEEIEVITETERDNLRLQYRRLWELRATLEEDEELTDPNRINKKPKQQMETAKKTPAPIQKQKPLQREVIYHDHNIQNQHQKPLQGEIESQIKSSPDQSPEPEAVTSHTTSFESNTEPCVEEGVSWHLLQLPSYESRRQTYKNILSWRLRRMEAKGVRQPSQEDTSFDSVDTEGSSTDASRLEQVTTSFESTTDNTDSTGGTEGQTTHSLQKLRADSGYRSIENPAPAPKPTRHLPLGDSSEHDGPLRLISPEESDRESLIKFARKHPINLGDTNDDRVTHRHPSLGDSGDLDNPPPAAMSSKRLDEERRPCKTAENVAIDEGIEELEPDAWEGRRRSCGRSASKKRRQFGRTVVDVDNPVLHRRCHSLRNTCSTAYARDYSVDEKSDALFREFSRCEPWSVDAVPRQRLVPSGSSYHRLQPHVHSRHSTASYSQAYPAEIIRKKSLSNRNIEDVVSSSLGYAEVDTRLNEVDGICAASNSSDQS